MFKLEIPESRIKDAGASSLAAALRQMRDMNTLELNFTGSKIADAGAKDLAAACCGMEKLMALGLKFEGCPISDELLIQVAHLKIVLEKREAALKSDDLLLIEQAMDEAD